ncbi:MAG: TAT-dependent nitrous-oxide reductase [Acidobacteriota bacterium]|jgi:nitrous-oxide reductase
MNARTKLVVLISVLAVGAALACTPAAETGQGDVQLAARSYVGVGDWDKYYAFLSGGQSGSVFVYGLPSGRYIRSIPVFEPRAGYGYANVPGTDSYERLAATGGFWGDTHHPILSETGGDYDGRWLWINDKANSRVARISLATFETVAVARIANLHGTHGIAVISPDTAHIIVNGEFEGEVPAGPPDPAEYASVMAFLEPESLDVEFEVLLPGNADINDASKDGRWAFTTIYNLERGLTVEEMIRLDEDAIAAIDIPAAQRALAAGEFNTVGGVPVIDPNATTEKVLYLVPVPKNPHGCDVTPDGRYVMGSGKLSPTVTVIDISQIDQVGNTREAIVAEPTVGLGPLHTTFDGRGNAYTSLFVDSQIVKWNIDAAVAGSPDYVVDRLDVHYNVGHTQATLAETMHPTGEYLVALNKLSKDMFLPVGPTMPENQELIDISGDRMQMLANFPSEPEPHDAVFMLADDLAPKVTQVEELGPEAVTDETTRVERIGPNEVHVYMTAIRSKYSINNFTVRQGDKVTITVTNVETIRDMSHGFALDGYGINVAIDPGQTREVTLVADKPGTFWYYCTWFCSALHLEMRGRMLVEPAAPAPDDPAPDTDGPASAAPGTGGGIR